jgi:GNAT superfamily N-acetyltransferase
MVAREAAVGRVDVVAVPVSGPVGTALLREYFTEMASRYYRRPATAAEIDSALAEDPSDDLAAPTGWFALAGSVARPLGCVGLRLRPGYAELTRLFVRPEARGRGVGRLLIARAEQHAAAGGAPVIRLDTRDDLIEARALYAACGYTEIEPYSAGPYAEHWFEKRLEVSPGSPAPA